MSPQPPKSIDPCDRCGRLCKRVSRYSSFLCTGPTDAPKSEGPCVVCNDTGIDLLLMAVGGERTPCPACPGGDLRPPAKPATTAAALRLLTGP